MADLRARYHAAGRDLPNVARCLPSRCVYETRAHTRRSPSAPTHSRELARVVLVPHGMSHEKDRNQGEGDRISARRYDRNVREFIAEGKVPDAANEARLFVERDAREAREAEREAKRGPKGERWVSVDEIVAKGHSVVERVRPIVGRALGRLRHRFGRK